jgi:hypothetical protein
LAIAISNILFAQKPVITPQVPVTPVPFFIIISDITVYEQPGYQGRSGNFRMLDGRLVAPFPVSNCSFTVPPGKIVYIKRCNEFINEIAYIGGQANINLEGICGIRSDDAGLVSVQFCGISTIIHNNDCRRIFGNIKVKILENAPGANPPMSTMAFTSRDNFKGEDFDTFLPFSNANANTNPGYTNHVLDEGHFRSTMLGIVGNSTVGYAVANFWVGKIALREGRVRIVITSDLGSAHKNCETCDDFSSNIKMATPVISNIPINQAFEGGRIVDATHNRLIVGPFVAQGRRDGWAIGAVGNPITIQFRAHFKLVGL